MLVEIFSKEPQHPVGVQCGFSFFFVVCLFIDCFMSEPLYNERELFQRIANGDEQAFAQIFFHYTSIIHPFVFNKVKSQAAAEEIVQEVFLKLWTKREALKNIESPASYLMRIATNKTLDHLRRKA